LFGSFFLYLLWMSTIFIFIFIFFYYFIFLHCTFYLLHFLLSF
jgi:hypothetical protein